MTALGTTLERNSNVTASAVSRALETIMAMLVAALGAGPTSSGHRGLARWSQAFGKWLVDATITADYDALSAGRDALIAHRAAALDADSDRALGAIDALLEAATAATERAEQALTAATLDPTSWAAKMLVAIQQRPGLNSKDLADALDSVDPTQISRSGRTLVERGLALKTREGRFQAWTLTPRGDALANSLATRTAAAPQLEDAVDDLWALFDQIEDDSSRIVLDEATLSARADAASEWLCSAERPHEISAPWRQYLNHLVAPGRHRHSEPHSRLEHSLGLLLMYSAVAADRSDDDVTIIGRAPIGQVHSLLQSTPSVVVESGQRPVAAWAAVGGLHRTNLQRRVRAYEGLWILGDNVAAVLDTDTHAAETATADRTERKKPVTKPGIETFHEDGQWKSRRQGSTRAFSVGGTKAEQTANGRAAAQRDHVEHTIKKLDGTIGQKNSYGNDPNPPRDKR